MITVAVGGRYSLDRAGLAAFVGSLPGLRLVSLHSSPPPQVLIWDAAGGEGLDRLPLLPPETALLRFSRLDHAIERRAEYLSGGMKKKLALSSALVYSPQVLFLYEPTTGVDPLSRRSFWDLIYDLSESGVTVFVTTHYMDEAEHCDRLGLIYNGRLIALGSPASLRSNMRAGQMLEVACPQPLRAIRSIRKVDGLISAGLYGDRVHALVEDAARLVPESCIWPWSWTPGAAGWSGGP